MALTDFSGAFAPPNKLKPKSLFEFAAPSFDDSSDLENTHTTGESPTNAAYLPPGSRPTSNPTVSSAYAPPSGSVTAPSLGQQTRPDIVSDIYAPRLRDVTEKLDQAYSAPRPGGIRGTIGALLGARAPVLGDLISGDYSRKQQIKPLQQEYGLLSNAIGAQRAQNTADLSAQNIQSEIGHRASQDAIANRLADVKEDPAAKGPTNPLELFLKDPVKAKQYMDMQAESKPDKTPGEKEQEVTDYLSGHNMPNTAAMRDKARMVLATRNRPPKDPELADINKQLKEAQLDKALHPKPTVAEQNRADLADNLNENLDKLEDIVNRRPELFGPLSGRLTEGKAAFGSNDPDIAQLANIKHQAGMAQISSHGMRSAQGIQGAADALMNFHSGPEGIKSSIKSARDSVKVFKNQVDAVKNPGGDSSSAAPTSGAAPLPSFADWKKGQSAKP